MRDKSHFEQVERWAEYVKNNPDWKSKLRPFLDSQIMIARRVYTELLKTPEGRKKIMELKGIKK